jgi:CubicO group peptidase (beta-lactamase class C family)
MIRQYNKYRSIFNSISNNKYVHESIVFIESETNNISFTEQKGGVNLDTPFLMASITKLFTTSVIMVLIEEKKISLNNKISDYLSDDIIKGLHIYKNKEYGNELTIGNLLYQTSGLPDAYLDGNNSLNKRVIEEDFSISFEESIDLIKNMKPHFSPNEEKRAYYSDTNFDILGVIIEKITNMSLEDVFSKYIFSPLNLVNTYLPKDDNKIPYAYYKHQKLSRPKILLSSIASGGYITTANDLMKFIKAFFRGILFSKDTLDLNTYRKMQFNMGPIKYGMGHMKISLEGLMTMYLGKGNLFGHCGSLGSFAFYYPERDLFMVGNFNQMAKPAFPIRFVLRTAFCTKTHNPKHEN